MTIQAVKSCSTKRATIPLPRVLPKAARMKVENAIEQHLSAVDALTAFLDEADGDAELEPSLGSVEGWSGRDQRLWSMCDNNDLEEQVEDEGVQEGL